MQCRGFAAPRPSEDKEQPLIGQRKAHLFERFHRHALLRRVRLAYLAERDHAFIPLFRKYNLYKLFVASLFCVPFLIFNSSLYFKIILIQNLQIASTGSPVNDTFVPKAYVNLYSPFSNIR